MDAQLIPSSFELLMRTSPYLCLKVHLNSTPHNILSFFVCQRYLEGFATVEEKKSNKFSEANLLLLFYSSVLTGKSHHHTRSVLPV